MHRILFHEYTDLLLKTLNFLEEGIDERILHVVVVVAVFTVAWLFVL